MKQETTEKILEENRRIYNEIARDFARTRQGKWFDLLPFRQFIKAGGRLLDVGSGSGRLYEALRGQEIEFFGIDTSEEMVKFCREKFEQGPKTHFELGDILKIPFSDNYFDVVFCLATLHHIPSRELRLKALGELQRVLKPGGKLIMTNWYWWRAPAILVIFKFWLKKIFNITISYSNILENIRIVNRSLLNLSSNLQHSHILKNVRMLLDFDFGDIFVPWGKVGLRYLHSFRKKELKKLLLEAGFKNINQHLARKHGDHWGKRVNLITIAEK